MGRDAGDASAFADQVVRLAEAAASAAAKL
jgi:hypothetical protein